MAGITTLYAGARFRSRVEARWATFFDDMGWRWDYEPLDLDGYIPDFVLHFYRPMLVEVKSALSLKELEESASKIDRSGWKGEALIVGATFFESYGGAVIGLLREGDEGWSGAWGNADFGTCRKCTSKSFFHTDMSYRCRVDGCYDGDHYRDLMAYDDAIRLWRRSANRTQWMPHRESRPL